MNTFIFLKDSVNNKYIDITNDNFVSFNDESRKDCYLNVFNLYNTKKINEFTIEIYNKVALNQELYISELSDDKREIRCTIRGANEYNSLLNVFNLKKIHIYVSGSFIKLDGLNLSTNNDEMILVFADNLRLNNGDQINLLTKEYSSDSITVQVLNDKIPETFKVLNGSKKNNLVNVQSYRKERSSTEYTLESIQNIIQTENIELYSNLKNEDKKINYNIFSNFVFFGSAIKKISNAHNKIIKLQSIIDLYQESIDNNFENVIINKRKKDFEEYFETFTSYEKWLFMTKYKKLSTENYQLYIQNKLQDAENYDIENVNHIIYSVPHTLIDGDKNTFFLNFLYVIADVFDNSFEYINQLKALNEYSLSENITQIPQKLISELIEDFGISSDYTSTEKEIEKYFTTENGIKEVSLNISKRLLNTIPLLYQSKGTLNVIDFIFNIFGIPKNVFDIYEFSNVFSQDDRILETLRTYSNYFLKKKSTNENIIVNLANTDLLENWHSTELILYNISQSSSIIKYTDNEELVLTNIGSIGYNISSSNVLSETPILNPNLWTYIYFDRNKVTNTGSFQIVQKINDTIVNSYSQSVNFTTNFPSFASVNILSSSIGSIHSYRVYDKQLSFLEKSTHYKNFRNVAEENPSKIKLNFHFEKPSNQNYSQSFSKINSFTASFTNISSDNYNIDTFYDTLNLQRLPDPMLQGSKIRSTTITSNTSSSLNAWTRTQTINDNIKDYSRVGIFISPNDDIEQFIENNINIRKSYVPNDVVNTNKYFFEELEKETKILDDKILTITNSNYYDFILNLVNKKIFQLIKEFIPANTDLEYGLLIKNIFLKRNRIPHLPSIMKIQSVGFTESSEKIQHPKINSLSNKFSFKDIEVGNAQINSLSNKFIFKNVDIDSQMGVVNKLENSISLIEKNIHSLYLNMIETTNKDSVEFWTKSLFKSMSTNFISDNIDKYEDLGATLTVKE